jgi:hypothetical protein
MVLWSQYSAESPHVKREISIADEHDLLIFPVQLEDQAHGNYYLRGVNWVRMQDLGAERVARAIEEHLRVTDLPFPLGDLYNHTIKGKLDLRLHLTSTRLLTRFILVAQIARPRKRHQPTSAWKM